MRVTREVTQTLERILIVPERKQLILDFGAEGTETLELPDALLDAVRALLAKHFKSVEDMRDGV